MGVRHLLVAHVPRLDEPAIALGVGILGVDKCERADLAPNLVGSLGDHRGLEDMNFRRRHSRTPGNQDPGSSIGRSAQPPSKSNWIRLPPTIADGSQGNSGVASMRLYSFPVGSYPIDNL